MAEDSKGKKSWFSRHRFRHESPARQTANIQQDTAPKQSSSNVPATDLVVTTNLKNTADITKPASNYSTDKLLLWREAYKALKDDPETQGMVVHYESFLRDPANGLVKTASELDDRPEPEQMDLLLDRSLEKTARMDKVDRRLAFAIDIVLSVKEIVGTAVSSVPIAAAAWTPICIALEFLVKSPKESQENLNGVVEVVKKMKWYSNLSLLLLADNLRGRDNRYIDLRAQLADLIRDLYKAILDYIIKTICVHHQNVVSRFASNIFRSWQDKLDAILKAETTVKDFADQHCNQQMKTQLELLLDFHLTKEESAVTSKLSGRNMLDEMTALENRKDKLIPNSYSWISTKPEYKQFMAWDSQSGARVLWIKGAAGTGKTMIMIGLIRDLHEHFNLPSLCYFFCQGTNDELNTATAILKGLMAMLIRQNKALFEHIFKEVKACGDRFLTANDAFPTLKRLFLDMIRDQALERAVFVVDALDECKHTESKDTQAGLVALLELITETVQTSNKVKWLVSGRNIEHIADAFAERVDDASQVDTLYDSIEVNRESVADGVDLFIERKVDELKQKHAPKKGGRGPKSAQKRLEEQEETLNEVGDQIRQRTDGTFLWVSLVFRELKDCETRNMLEQLEKIPSDLKKLYAQMIQRISVSPHKESYRRAITAAVLAYRPLGVAEMMMFADQLGEDPNFLENCGLLTVRDSVVNLLHQSTLDYLKERPDDAIRELFPQGYGNGHAEVIKASLEAMKDDLADEDMRLKHPATPREELSDLGYLVVVRYSCRYWIDHFCDMPETERKNGLYDSVFTFLKIRLPDWLVALCLMQELPPAMLLIRRLQKLLQHEQPDPQLLRLIEDADRFCRLTKDGIEKYPLQVYYSASLFTPACSLMKELFNSQKPDFIPNAPIMEDDWDACQQTFQINGEVNGLFWEEGKIASTVRLGKSGFEFVDLDTGSRSQWFEPSIPSLDATVFSPDGRLLASVEGKSIKIWNVMERKRRCEIHLEAAGTVSLGSITFSPSRLELAVGVEHAEGSPTVSIYDLEDESLAPLIMQVTPDGPAPDLFCGLEYSPDGSLLATVAKGVQVWDVQTGVCKSRVNQTPDRNARSFSADGKLLAVVDEYDLKIWSIETPIASLVRKFRTYKDTGKPEILYCVTFLPDPRFVAVGRLDSAIFILDLCHGDRPAKLAGHDGIVYSLSCSKDGMLLASESSDGTVKLWAISKTQSYLLDSRKDSRHGSAMASSSISPDASLFSTGSASFARVWNIDGTRVRNMAKATSDGAIAISPRNDMFATIRDRCLTVWNKTGHPCIRLDDSDSYYRSIQFSPCGTMITALAGSEIQTWSLAGTTWPVKSSIKRESGGWTNTRAIAFSSDGNLVAFEDHHLGPCIKIWSLSDGREEARIPLGDVRISLLDRSFVSFCFSQNGKRLLSSTLDGRMQVWNVEKKGLLYEFQGNKGMYPSLIDNGPLISTKRGIFLLPPTPSSNETDAQKVVSQFRGPGISNSDEWITWDGQNLLWLPPPYRPKLEGSDVRNRTVVIECGSGQVYVIRLKDYFDGYELPSKSDAGSAVVA